MQKYVKIFHCKGSGKGDIGLDLHQVLKMKLGI